MVDDGTNTHQPVQKQEKLQVHQGASCFPNLMKKRNKRHCPEPNDGKDVEEGTTPGSNTSPSVPVVAIPQQQQQQQPNSQIQQQQPPTKKLFSIFNFQTTKSQKPSSSKSQPIRNHVSNSKITSRSSSASTSSSSSTKIITPNRNIYIDLDGVLVDFDYGVQQLENIYQQSKRPNKPLKFNMWSTIQRQKHFYRTLPWTQDGKELWNFLVSLNHHHHYDRATTSSSVPSFPLHILTGVPWNCSDTAARDKFHWCQRELQWNYPTVTTTPTLQLSPQEKNQQSSPLLDTTTYISTTTTTAITETTTRLDNTVPNGASTTTTTPTTTTIIMESQRIWYWKNMAGPKRTHQCMNSTLPSPCKKIKVSTTTTTDTMETKNDDIVDVAATASQSIHIDEYHPTVITCWSVNKHLECRTGNTNNSGDILIDDRPTNHNLRQKWENAGGIFIHHTSTQNTIQQLIQVLGILE